MTKRMGRSITLVSLLLVAVMCLFVCSCKKAPEPAAPTETETPAAEVPVEAPAAPAEAPAAEAPAAPNTPK